MISVKNVRLRPYVLLMVWSGMMIIVKNVKLGLEVLLMVRDDDNCEECVVQT